MRVPPPNSPKNCNFSRYGNQISLLVENSFLHLLMRLWARDGLAPICHMAKNQHFGTLRPYGLRLSALQPVIPSPIELE